MSYATKANPSPSQRRRKNGRADAQENPHNQQSSPARECVWCVNVTTHQTRGGLWANLSAQSQTGIGVVLEMMVDLQASAKATGFTRARNLL